VVPFGSANQSVNNLNAGTQGRQITVSFTVLRTL
jgi:hypothetical protein